MHAAIVDPSRVVLKMIAQLLAERGDTASEFVDSESALRCIKGDPTVDILITSLEVLPMTGLELCWEARLAIPAQRPLFIIVMSSLSDELKLAEALDCGADDLIAKPVNRLELHARLRLAGRLKSAQLHLVALAETDPLTGLFNRRAFFDRLNKAIELGGKPVSAIMFDIDHFKRINDLEGHDVGDLVIRRVAGEAAKIAGIAGRLGGEEFAVILEGCDERGTFRLAETLRQSCANASFSGHAGPFQMTCSFGVSIWVEGDTADTLLKKADVGLYRAKTDGRNRVRSAARAYEDMPPMPSAMVRQQERH